MTESNEFLFAQLTAYVINFSQRGPKEPTHPKDFMPSQIVRSLPVDSAPSGKRRKRSVIAGSLRSTMHHFMR